MRPYPVLAFWASKTVATLRAGTPSDLVPVCTVELRVPLRLLVAESFFPIHPTTMDRAQ
jgi:hypothetical protein